MEARDYGLTIHPHGVALHSDRRPRSVTVHGEIVAAQLPGGGGRRKQIRGFSKASRRKLAMKAANAPAPFASLLTLTYHGLQVEGETEEARNLRIARRAKRDLNRFLSATRPELGRYLWVMEFQGRGVVHFHLLCEHEVDAVRASLAWCRATGELVDLAALRHAVRVDKVREQMAARSYVGRYLNKIDQKQLPPGVAAAGRWWGSSRGMRPVVLDSVLTCEADSAATHGAGVRTVRVLRRWLSRELGWKFRGGWFVSWGDKLVPRLLEAVRELRAFYGPSLPWAEVAEAIEHAEVAS
jgi:hypothetical protein